jgi:hypothetical protein
VHVEAVEHVELEANGARVRLKPGEQAAFSSLSGHRARGRNQTTPRPPDGP